MADALEDKSSRIGGVARHGESSEASLSQAYSAASEALKEASGKSLKPSPSWREIDNQRINSSETLMTEGGPASMEMAFCAHQR